MTGHPGPRLSPQPLTAKKGQRDSEPLTLHESPAMSPTGTLAPSRPAIGKVCASGKPPGSSGADHHCGVDPGSGSNPAAPKVGIRASQPKRSGTCHHSDPIPRWDRVYLHAVSTFARRSLAWKVAPAFHPVTTVEIPAGRSKGWATAIRPCWPTAASKLNGSVDSLVSLRDAEIAPGPHRDHFLQFDDESWWPAQAPVVSYLNTSPVRPSRSWSRSMCRAHTRLPPSAFLGQTPTSVLQYRNNFPHELEALAKEARQSLA